MRRGLNSLWQVGVQLFLGQRQEQLGHCHDNGDSEDLRVHVLFLLTQLVACHVNLEEKER